MGNKSTFSAIMNSVGKAVANVGRVAGKQAIAFYRSIDPDVSRHFLQMPLLTYSLLLSRRFVVVPQESDGYRPLIFVHGLGGGHADFLPMAGFFWLKGRR